MRKRTFFSRFASRRCIVILTVCLLLSGAVLFTGIDRTPARSCSGSSFSGAFTRAPSARRFRVATFNIHFGRTADRQPGLELAARTLQDFDFVGLQEVGGCPAWWGESQAEYLGRALALTWCFAPTERRWWHDHAGNGALTNLAVTRWSTTPLAGTRGKAYRNYLLTEVRVHQSTVTLVATHIDRRVDRDAQLDTVSALFVGLPVPAVLMGDMNADRSHPAIRRLCDTEGVVEPFSSLSIEDDDGRIDWIFVRGLSVLSAGKKDLGASDHPCIWAEVELPTGARE